MHEVSDLTTVRLNSHLSVTRQRPAVDLDRLVVSLHPYMRRVSWNALSFRIWASESLETEDTDDGKEKMVFIGETIQIQAT